MCQVRRKDQTADPPDEQAEQHDDDKRDEDSKESEDSFHRMAPGEVLHRSGENLQVLSGIYINGGRKRYPPRYVGMYAIPGDSVMISEMKSTRFKRMWRFWPGLISLTATFLMLSWWMEPRPRTVATFPFDSSYCSLGHAISPDGSYLASLATGIASGHGAYLSRFALHDMHSQREVFCMAEYINDFRFAADGSLAYLVAKRHRGAGKKELLELHRWRPDTLQAKKVWEHESIDPYTIYRDIDPVTKVAFVDCKLSPDAQTILLATYVKDTIRCEIIDGYSGVARTSFTIHPNEPQALLLADVHVKFASDSKSIVVQTCEVHGMEKQYFWHWIDAPSGQVQQAMKLPEGLVTPEFLFATASSPVSKATNLQGDHLLVTVSNKQIQVIQLAEVKPPPLEKHLPEIQTHIFSFEQTAEQNCIAYYWSHFRRIDSNATESLPGCYWAIRHLATEKLLNTSRLNTGNHPESDEKRYYYYLVNTLPGPTMVFMQGNIENDKMNGLVKEYLSRLRTWLGIQPIKTGQLLFISGTTGELARTLRVPQNQTTVYLSKDGKSLNVLSGFDQLIELRTYDYPLHQPWLLICSWALGVALVITLLSELRRWKRHRTDATASLLCDSVRRT